ncbi:uncharacterized protein [Watersipora subatra]|uniref:uncharacterized protein isoform X2 n=1 Tax=Watersipora subatra TaxID=2589382 RepID=UPI00355AFFA5
MRSTSSVDSTELGALEIKRREAESDIAGFKEERLRNSLNKEQAKYLEMTKASYTYDPWGKPGAGAPFSSVEHKRKKFTEYDGFKNDVGLGGLIDDLGLNTQPRLGTQSEKSLEETQAKINNYRQELRMPFEYFDPWGQGQGNPRRGNDGYVERFAGIKERGIVPPLDDTVVKKATEVLKDQNIGVGLDTKSPYGGGGEPNKTRSGNVKTRFPTTMKRDIYGNASLEESTYDPFKSMSVDSGTTYFPFGRPGGGAPLRNEDGKLAPQRRGVDFVRELDSSAEVHKRREAADQYLIEIKKEIHEQRRNRELELMDHKAPIGELAAVVREGKVGFPKRDPGTGQLVSQHKGTSDVTKHKMGKSNHRFAGIRGENNSMANPKEYHNELSQLADERHRQRQRDKELELKQENKHSENWSDMWGRPGGGAPMERDAGFKKTKLNEALHYPKPKNVPLPATKVPKQISSHENNFQLPEDRSLFKPQKGFGVLAPYATY